MAKKTTTKYLVEIRYRWTNFSCIFNDAESAAVFADNCYTNFAPAWSEGYGDEKRTIDVSIRLISEQENFEKIDEYLATFTKEENSEENQQ